jgi:hypothetical protein
MNLVRNIQQASLLTGLVLASLFVCNNPARADQKACVITDEGATVCGKLTSIKPPTNRPPVADNQVQTDKITFSLKGCKRYGKAVQCTFEIVNRGKEEKELMSRTADSYMIDSTGTSYRGYQLDIGGELSNYDMTGRLKVSPNLDYLVSITINDIPQEVNKAKILEFKFKNRLSKPVQFRNVPILD